LLDILLSFWPIYFVDDPVLHFESQWR